MKRLVLFLQQLAGLSKLPALVGAVLLVKYCERLEEKQ